MFRPILANSTSTSSVSSTYDSPEEKEATTTAANNPHDAPMQHSTQTIEQLSHNDIATARASFQELLSTHNMGILHQTINQTLFDLDTLYNSNHLQAQVKTNQLMALYHKLSPIQEHIDNLLATCNDIHQNSNSAVQLLDTQMEQKKREIADMCNILSTEDPAYLAANHRLNELGRDHSQQKNNLRAIKKNALGALDPYYRLVSLKSQVILAKEGKVYQSLEKQMEQQYEEFSSSMIVAGEELDGAYSDTIARLARIETLQKNNQARYHSEGMRLIPNKDSKYSHSHSMSFTHKGFLQPLFMESLAYLNSHYEHKGIQHQQYLIDITAVADADVTPALQDALQSIPVDEAAAIPEVQHTKITLELHGNTDHILHVVEPNFRKKYQIKPEQMADYLANHLPPGNYQNKLTLAIRPCNAAYKEDGNDLSSVERIGNRLTERNYSGIKLTGSLGIIQIQDRSNDDCLIGSTLTQGDDGYLNKFSHSNDKRTIYI